jgi:hypothetical protein
MIPRGRKWPALVPSPGAKTKGKLRPPTACGSMGLLGARLPTSRGSMGGGAWSGIRVWCGNSEKRRSGLPRVALRCVSLTGFIREPTSPFFPPGGERERDQRQDLLRSRTSVCAHPVTVRAGFFWIAGAGAAGDETKSIRAQAQLQATQTKSIQSFSHGE